MDYTIGYVIGLLIYMIVFGFITKYVAESKGYEGGFWWGFCLGLIGLLVVGFRPNVKNETSYSSYQSASNNYLGYQTQTSRTVAPAVKKEVKKWTCIKCKADNPQKSKFCCDCGEPRHYEWKCGNCGEINEAKVRFCFNCGKEKSPGEELLPEIETEGLTDTATSITEIDDYNIKCNKCGTIQKRDRICCWNCGAAFKEL